MTLPCACKRDLSSERCVEGPLAMVPCQMSSSVWHRGAHRLHLLPDFLDCAETGAISSLSHSAFGWTSIARSQASCAGGVIDRDEGACLAMSATPSDGTIAVSRGRRERLCCVSAHGGGRGCDGFACRADRRNPSRTAAFRHLNLLCALPKVVVQASRIAPKLGVTGSGSRRAARPDLL